MWGMKRFVLEVADLKSTFWNLILKNFPFNLFNLELIVILWNNEKQKITFKSFKI